MNIATHTVEARMSPSVSFSEEKPVPWCPQVRYSHLPVLSELMLRSNQTARCDECMSPQTRGEYSCGFLALCEQVFCFLAFFGLNTVVFLPGALRSRTHTLFSFSKSGQEYSTLTHVCQAGILLAWKRNQNIQQCGSLRKICRLLHVFGNCMDVSQIRRRFDWLCKLWQGKSSPPTHHAPKGRPIHPRLKKSGAFWSVHCK
jgi:hypothetical protein